MSEPTDILVRDETSADSGAVRAIVVAAFGQPLEADLVDRLRGQPEVFGLVAVCDGEVVGHILFSPIRHLQPDGIVIGTGLAPLAVSPECQNRGIGARLVRAGLERCRLRGDRRIFVLGEPTYYRRFGFESAAAKGIRCKWEVPEGAFMLLDFEPGADGSIEGLVHYAPAFDMF